MAELSHFCWLSKTSQVAELSHGRIKLLVSVWIAKAYDEIWAYLELSGKSYGGKSSGGGGEERSSPPVVRVGADEL